MAAEADVFNKAGFISFVDVTKIKRLIREFDLPTEIPVKLDASSIISAMKQDKKSTGEKIRLPLLKGIGYCQVEEVSWEIF